MDQPLPLSRRSSLAESSASAPISVRRKGKAPAAPKLAPTSAKPATAAPKLAPGPSTYKQAPQSQKTIDPNEVRRPCAEHFFLTDVADVRQMEKGLLKLLEDFHNGKLQVFGKGCTFEQMDQVREKQEKLSRLHFDLDAQQQLQGNDEDAKDVTIRNLTRLVQNLEDLSHSVHNLKGSTLPPKSAGHQSSSSPDKAAASAPAARSNVKGGVWTEQTEG